jgi:Citrate lyase, alpha subunit (CitF)
MRNAVGREIPERIEGYRSVKPFTSAFANLGTVTKAPIRLSSAVPGKSKVLPNIRTALDACDLKEGATISFHQHLRNGDHVLNMVLQEIPGWDSRTSELRQVHCSQSTPRSSNISGRKSSLAFIPPTCPGRWRMQSLAARLRCLQSCRRTAAVPSHQGRRSAY